MNYECEKIEEEGASEAFIKLIIYCLEDDGTSAVWDITHHETETAADEWLITHWNLLSPPPIGTRHKFEA